MADELISVIIPVFNVEKYLRACLDSVVTQSYPRLEILLIDDGSTDDSGKICEEYAARDIRMKVIHQKNRGLSAARNAGLASSTGTYVAFVDSDDLIEKDYIRVMYDAMRRADCDLVCCEFLCFMDGRDSEAEKHWKQKEKEEITTTVYDRNRMLELSFYQHLSVTAAQQKLYHRKLFEDILFPEGRYFEDLATTYRFVSKAGRVAVIDQKLYGYRIRESGIMNEGFHARKLDCIWVSDRLYTDIRQELPELTDAAACAAFRVNRLVFHQIPGRESAWRTQVWEEIKKYRGTVVVDSKAQKYERLLALSSYGGKRIFYFALKTFKILREMKIKYRLG